MKKRRNEPSQKAANSRETVPPIKEKRFEEELPDFSQELRDFCPSRDRDYGPSS
ncbi:hypothetical protein [Gallaecimonas mangrovi]|uniref:hypothetical protein n=1 Tax=Gallaecimonas mangrovi TaxID=2291597 RepID=UPI001865F64C|nr:hypothetical protein [Gallaecimonas mangrovi]